MKGTTLPVAESPGTSRGWAAQYEKDFAAQKSSGPIVFTEEQRQKNKEVLRRVSDLLPFEDAYKVNDCDLIYRFLIGKHWNVNHAEKGLREYMALRKKNHLDGVIGEQLHPTIEALLCPCYSDGTPCPIYGLDQDGLPILWLSPDASKVIAAMKQFTEEQLLRGQMRVSELGRFVCRASGVDRCTYVIDLGGITMSSVNKATLGFLKGVMNLLQCAYPEIVRRMLIFNTGWAVSAAWKVLRPLVDVRVQDKIKFESKAPTLAALQPYMTADQVHPAFGGTGKENALEALTAAEVRRVRRLAEGEVSFVSSLPLRGPSITHHDDGSLFDVDLHTTHSFCCPIPGTACPTPNDTSHNHSPDDAVTTLDRMVIGAPRAVSAWMANMGEECEDKDALAASLSGASGSCDGPVDMSTTEANTSQRLSLKTDEAFSAGAAATDVPPPSSTCEPFRDMESESRCGAQEEELPLVAISLTYGADGSITGYCGQTCVGQFRNGRLYAVPKELASDPAGSRATSPFTASPAFLPGNRNNRNGASSGRRSEQQWQQLSTSQDNPLIGELLYEAGHPIHHFYIVCDGNRRARYLLRRSRLRTQLRVYSVADDARVRTEKSNHHYVEGERWGLGVAVPSADPGSNAKGDWMLYGEDGMQRSPGRHIKNLFSRTRRSSAPAADESGSNKAEKEKDARWFTSIITAVRTGASSAILSPSTRKTQSNTRRGADDTPIAGAWCPREAKWTPSAADSDNNSNSGTPLLAQNKGQTVYYYGLLTKSPLSDLFALAVAMTLSWSGELECLRDKASSKTKRCVPDYEEELMSRGVEEGRA